MTRPIDSSYDRNSANATTALLDALKKIHKIETHCNGNVEVDGEMVESATFDAQAMTWDGTADGLEELGWEQAAEAMRDDAEADSADNGDADAVEIQSVLYAEHCSAPFPAAEIPAAEWSRLESAVAKALAAAYPDAVVIVSIRHGVSGCGSGATYRSGGVAEVEQSRDCDEIVGRAWQAWSESLPAPVESVEGAHLTPSDSAGPSRRWSVSTDAISTTVCAHDEDEAARLFAASEHVADIESAADLRAWAERDGGWCRIVKQ